MTVKKQPKSFVRRALESFWALFGAIWLVVGLPFLVTGIWVAVQQAVEPNRLSQSGLTVEAIVLVKALTGEGDTPEVTFRFTSASGAVVKATATVRPEVWDRLAERGPIRVTYLPQHPSTFRVEGQKSDAALPWIFTGVGGFFSLGGGFAFGYGLRQARRRR